MKYLILIYSNPESRKIWEGFSADERSVGLAAYAALTEDLEESGELIVTEALADPSMTKRSAISTLELGDGQTNGISGLNN